MAYLALLLAVVADTALRVIGPDRLGLPVLPDLALLTALFIGFRARSSRDLGLAVVLGLFADCFSACPLGHFAFLYGTAAYLALHMRRYVPSDAFVSHIVACVFCGALTAVAAMLIALLTGASHIGGGFLRAMVQVLVSAAAAPVVFGVWDRTRLFRRSLGGTRYEFAG